MNYRWCVVGVLLLGLLGCSAPQTASAGVYVISSTDLYQVELPPGQLERRIGKLRDAQGNGVVLLDIALNPRDGQLYGVNDALYRIDKNTAVLTRVGDGLQAAAPGISSEAVALAFSSDGVLYTGVDGNRLATVDTATGRVAVLGSLGGSYSYSGDLAFAPDGRLFASASGRDINDELLLVNPQTGAGTPIGNIGFRKVYGMQFIGGTLYGVSEGDSSSLIAVDTATGQGTMVSTLGFRAWGIQRVR
ncbi:MAG: hypothetical protein SFU83_18710 [Meiothermus sp.]|nr:hypothetical protein [Meiothermus sp.]